jgi:hypothetical protein
VNWLEKPWTLSLEDRNKADPTQEMSEQEESAEEDDSEEEGFSEEEHEDGGDVATDKPRDDEDAKFSKREEEE